MQNKAEFENEFHKQEIMFFEKHFLDKPMPSIIYSEIEKALIILLQAQTRFVLIRNSLEIFKKYTNFADKVNAETKKEIQSARISVKLICKEINKILEPFTPEPGG